MNRFFTLLAVLLLCFPLAGCGSEETQVIEQTPESIQAALDEQESGDDNEIVGEDPADAAAARSMSNNPDP